MIAFHACNPSHSFSSVAHIYISSCSLQLLPIRAGCTYTAGIFVAACKPLVYVVAAAALSNRHPALLGGTDTYTKRKQEKHNVE